jgi:hypothetical protein
MPKNQNRLLEYSKRIADIWLLHCTCPLVTQSGHWIDPFRSASLNRYDATRSLRSGNEAA